jgi:hypothetical protein
VFECIITHPRVFERMADGDFAFNSMTDQKKIKVLFICMGNKLH